MVIRRSERISSAPVSTGGVRSAGARRVRSAESHFDKISLSAPAGQEASPAFREMAASLSQQVRTFNTTGKIQELHNQVASGSYRTDARETAARMLLMTEAE